MPDRPRKRSTPRRPAGPKPARAIAATPPPPEPDGFLRHVLALTNHRADVRALVAAQRARRRPPSRTAAPLRPVSPRVERQAYIDALETWQKAAAARLADLRAGRTGPGPDARPIPPERQAEAAGLMRRLAVRLSKNSVRLAMLQGAQGRWHVAAKAAREGIRLRRDAAGGAALRPDARLHLELARATFMVEGNSPRLREELGDAVWQLPRSRGLAYWLARYELMAGRYAAARDAVRNALDYPPVRSDVLPLLDPESAAAPWLSWPCNFYTYRYTLAGDDELRGMQSALAALSNNPELEATWTSFGIPVSAIALLKERAVAGGRALGSLLLWNQANRDMTHRKYASAARNYEACQRAILEYFADRFDLTLPMPPDESGSDTAPGHQLENALKRLASEVIRYDGPTRQIWNFFRERYMTIALDELHEHDWRRPKVVPLAYEFQRPLPDYGDSTDFATALARLLTQMSILKSLQTLGDKVEEKIDAPLVAIALVFCPLAIAEANRLRRSFDEALSQCRQLLHRHAQFKILSEVVEKPFVKILKAQILLDKADGQYKARTLASAPATNPDGSLEYQGLEAAETYQGVLTTFEDSGEYVNRVNAGLGSMRARLDGLLEHTFHPVAAREGLGPGTLPPLSSADRLELGLVGRRLSIETIVPRQGEYADPNRRIRPHEPLVRFEAPGGGEPPALLETNPVVYVVIVQARARLLQMESGLNYLGYSDDYVPPWRFQFLLDRSRYFAEHARNAQREYLNFLANAEREEFQELTASQNVEMEKANIRVETARVEQAGLEVESARAAEELARLTALNTEARLEAYEDFDREADRIAGTGTLGLLSGTLLSILPDPFSDAAGAVIDFYTGGAASRAIDRRIASLQRDYEKFSLELAASEAGQAAAVAARQLAVVRAGLLVAGMQRAAAVLRHEFAVQNLAFLRNRTLNAELWYRLAGAIRGVADTYLRHGVEIAFLAEQAYEFEVDKRIDVIRFDYDASELGDMLAADFLLRDLNTLEQDLIVGQRIRQQQVRYVLSLARELPAALQELRETGRTIFSLRLEQIERRFPGLFNVRVASVDVLPMALMDATRFSLELTHMGSGQVRLRADPSVPEAPRAADWLEGLETEWAIRPRITGPETAVFSGLTRQEQAQGSFAASQRGAFEGLPGAGAWRVDLSMKENRVVPDTLADLLVTFTLSGYYDAALRAAVDGARRATLASTTWLSAHQIFPDAFYAFHRTGRMEWDVGPGSLALHGSIGELQNVAVLCSPAQRRLELGRLMCAYAVEFDLDAAGQVRLARELPLLTLTTNGLALDAALATPPGTEVTFDCGDGSGPVASADMPHTYARPGRYEVLVRIAAGGRLTEYRVAVVVSSRHAVLPPCIAVPDLQTAVSGGTITLVPSLQPLGEPLSVTWRIDGRGPDAGSNPPSFTLAPGRHVLRFSAVRPLTARFHSRQRFVPAAPLAIEALRLATNRTFDVTTGAETTASLNAFGQHVFGPGSLSPVDRWTFELPLEDNPAAVSVSATDARQHDLSELTDVFLALEFRTSEA